MRYRTTKHPKRNVIYSQANAWVTEENDRGGHRYVVWNRTAPNVIMADSAYILNNAGLSRAQARVLVLANNLRGDFLLMLQRDPAMMTTPYKELVLSSLPKFAERRGLTPDEAKEFEQFVGRSIL